MENKGLNNPNLRALIDDLKKEDLVVPKNLENQIMNKIKNDRLKTELQKTKFIKDVLKNSGDLKESVSIIKKIKHPWYVIIYNTVINNIKSFFTKF